MSSLRSENPEPKEYRKRNDLAEFLNMNEIRPNLVNEFRLQPNDSANFSIDQLVDFLPNFV